MGNHLFCVMGFATRDEPHRGRRPREESTHRPCKAGDVDPEEGAKNTQRSHEEHHAGLGTDKAVVIPYESSHSMTMQNKLRGQTWGGVSITGKGVIFAGSFGNNV